MSHVISAQPSATSPYQPTAMQEGNGGDNPPRIHRIDSEQHGDCCINTRNKKGCCLFVCTLLSMCCQGCQNCAERCCDCCANYLNDCCEDKPRERNQRIYNKRYMNSGGNYYDNYDNTTDNNDDWGITSLSAQHMHVGVGSHLSEPAQDLLSNTNDGYNSSTHHTSGYDSGTQHGSETHHSSNVHDSGTHHGSETHHSSSGHDSGTHHSICHQNSGTHHTSSHDTSTTHDSGGGLDSGGGGCDSGGGDTGGGCDSGGGDSGGGGCDD